MAGRILKTLTWLLIFAKGTPASAPKGSLYRAPDEATYDYVIVGGGTAGLTVASRLAQAGNFTVGIIEAGSVFDQESGNHSVVPGYDYHGFGGPLGPYNPLSDWGFHTLPSAETANRSVLYARGKGLGGSSARNYLVYQRPSRGSMDQWAAAVSDGAWSWKNVLSYYQRSSRLHEPDVKYRGGNSTPLYDAEAFANGPIDVGYSNYPSPISSWGLAAFEEAGSNTQERGFQSGDLIGHGWMPSSLHGKRQERSTSTEYLKGGFGGRLAIHAHTFAKRIIFDGKAARAVQVETGTLLYQINARREVILSCGAFQTPQLLMVSGVGEKRLLSANDIPLIHALPAVGQNLQDNPGFGLSFSVNIDTAAKIIKNPTRMLAAINQYNNHRTGFLTSSGADAVNFEKIAHHAAYGLSPEAIRDLTTFSADWPEVQYWPLTTWPGQDVPGNSVATFVAGLIAPLSRGSVSIRSKDMADAPVIDAGWLTHPTDREVAIGAVRRMQQFIGTRAMRSVLQASTQHENSSAHINFDLKDSEILELIRKQLSTFYHAAGTCKMGVRQDESAVIDSRARVFGLQNLRVIDLSGVPFLPPGQPQATVYMLAERIADFILDDA